MSIMKSSFGLTEEQTPTDDHHALTQAGAGQISFRKDTSRRGAFLFLERQLALNEFESLLDRIPREAHSSSLFYPRESQVFISTVTVTWF